MKKPDILSPGPSYPPQQSMLLHQSWEREPAHTSHTVAPSLVAPPPTDDMEKNTFTFTQHQAPSTTSDQQQLSKFDPDDPVPLRSPPPPARLRTESDDRNAPTIVNINAGNVKQHIVRSELGKNAPKAASTAPKLDKFADHEMNEIYPVDLPPPSGMDGGPFLVGWRGGRRGSGSASGRSGSASSSRRSSGDRASGLEPILEVGIFGVCRYWTRWEYIVRLFCPQLGSSFSVSHGELGRCHSARRESGRPRRAVAPVAICTGMESGKMIPVLGSPIARGWPYSPWLAE